MSFSDSLVIHLKGGSPWGFTLAGGLDKRQLLTVSKVAVGGKAHKAGVVEGYSITKINGEETCQMNHNDAKSIIRNAGWQFVLELSKPGGWQQSDSFSVISNSSDVMPSPPSSVCSNASILRNQESTVQRDFYRPSPKPYSSSSSSCSERRSPAGSCCNLKKAEIKSRPKFSTPIQNNAEVKKGVDISQALVRLIKKEEEEKANEQKASSNLNSQHDFPSPPPSEGQQKSTTRKNIGNILSGAINATKSPPKAINEPDFTKTLEDRCVALGEPAVLRVDILPCLPQPTVHWYHNKKEVHTNVEKDVRVQNTKLTHTVILGTLSKDQTGWYTCTIINKHGSSSSRCQVTIDAKKNLSNKPAFMDERSYKKDANLSAQKVLTSSNQKLYSTQNSATAYKKQTNNKIKNDNLKKESEVLKALRLENEISQQPVRKSKTMQYLEHSLQSDDN